MGKKTERHQACNLKLPVFGKICKLYIEFKEAA